jgi:hypothetical protein
MKYMASGKDHTPEAVMIAQQDLEECTRQIETLATAKAQLQEMLADTIDEEKAAQTLALKSELEQVKVKLYDVKIKANELFAEAVSMLAEAGIVGVYKMSVQHVPFYDDIALKAAYLDKMPEKSKSKGTLNNRRLQLLHELQTL